MARETRRETDFWGNEKDITYEDGEKVEETRHEKTFFGTPVDRTYDTDGKLVSETRHEETILGTPVDRTYSTEGERISETRHEQTFAGTPVDRTYDTYGKPISETKWERTFWGARVKRTYDLAPTKPEPAKDSGSTGAYSEDYGRSRIPKPVPVNTPRRTLKILGVIGLVLIFAGVIISVVNDTKPDSPTVSSVSNGKDYPVCSDARNLSLNLERFARTFRLKESCWSGWITIPDSVTGFHIQTPSYIDFLFSSGRRVFLPSDTKQWPGEPPGRTFRLRGPGVATLQITQRLVCPPYQMCQAVEDFTLK